MGSGAARHGRAPHGGVGGKKGLGEPRGEAGEWGEVVGRSCVLLGIRVLLPGVGVLLLISLPRSTPVPRNVPKEAAGGMGTAAGGGSAGEATRQPRFSGPFRVNRVFSIARATGIELCLQFILIITK